MKLKDQRYTTTNGQRESCMACQHYETELLDKDNEDTFLHISTLPVLTDKDSGRTVPHFHTSRIIR